MEAKNISSYINDFWIKFFTMDNMLIDNFNYTDLNDLFFAPGKEIELTKKRELEKNFSSKNLCNIHGKLNESNIIFGSSSLSKKNSSGIDKESRRITVEQRDKVTSKISNLYILGHSVVGSDYSYLLDQMEIAENIIVFYYGEDYKLKLNGIPKNIKNRITLFPIVPFFKESVGKLNLGEEQKVRLFDQHADVKSNKRNKLLVSWLKYTEDSKLLYTNKKNLEFKWNFICNNDEVLKTLLDNSGSLKSLKIVNENEEPFVLKKELISIINTEKLELSNFIIDQDIEKILQKITTLKLINCKLNSDIQVYSRNLKGMYVVNLQNVNYEIYTIYIRQSINLQSLNIENSEGINLFYDNDTNINTFKTVVGNIELRNLNFSNMEVFHIEADNKVELDSISFTYDKVKKVLIDARQSSDFKEMKVLDVTSFISKRINYLPNLREFAVYGYPFDGRLDNLAENNIEFDGNILNVTSTSRSNEVNNKYNSKPTSVNEEGQNRGPVIDSKTLINHEVKTNEKPLTTNEKDKYKDHIKKYNIKDNEEHFFRLVEKQRSGKLLKSNSNEYVEVLKKSKTWKIPEEESTLKARIKFKKESYNLVNKNEGLEEME